MRAGAAPAARAGDGRGEPLLIVRNLTKYFPLYQPWLLGLARRVQAALAPVEPRPAFVSDLRAQLRGDAREARQTAERNRERRRKWIGLAAGLGGILYLLGLMTVSWRLSLAMLGLIAGLLGVRMARPAVPRIRPSH